MKRRTRPAQPALFGDPVTVAPPTRKPAALECAAAALGGVTRSVIDDPDQPRPAYDCACHAGALASRWEMVREVVRDEADGTLHRRGRWICRACHPAK